MYNNQTNITTRYNSQNNSQNNSQYYNQYNYQYISNNEIRNLNQNNDGFKISAIIKSIYNYFLKLIKGDEYIDNNEKIKLEQKFNESFNNYCEHYKNSMNIYIENPENSLVGLINLLNDCYIVSFLQILFHTPNFLNLLKKINNKNEDNIIHYLIKVSEYPFNINHYYKLKQLLGEINIEYSKPWANDSQEFGLDLINYIISHTNNPIEDIEYESPYCNDEELKNIKNKVYEDYISTYHKNKNEIEELFLFHQIDVFCTSEYKKPKISGNLYIELTIQNVMYYQITIEELLDYKYLSNISNINIKHDQIIIKSKLISLPNILIISINRCLNNQSINNNEVIFDEILDLKKYVDTDLFNIDNNKTKFNLYAINECFHNNRINHNFCKIKINKKWYLFDDEKKVLEINYNKKSKYVIGLFYIRES